MVFITAALRHNCIGQEIIGTEELLESVSQESDEAHELETIEYLRLNPIDLKNADASEITQIPSITLLHAKKIVEMIEKYPWADFAMIADSAGLSPHQEILLENCSTLDGKKLVGRPHFFWRARTKNYINEIRGIKENKFAGSPLDLYNRIQYSSDNYKFGVLTNKSTGEKSLSDFLSYHAEYNSDAFKIIAGDYTLELGLGSLLWRSFGSRKGAEVISPVAQLGRGIRSYASSMETSFFRGAASAYSTGNFKVTAWYSDIDRAAGIDPVNNVVNSMYVTGLYRTESELSKRDNINEKMAGADIQYKLDKFILGINSNYLEYSLPIESSSSRYFDGKNGLLSSAYAVYSNSKILLNAEVAKDAKDHLAARSNFQAIAKYFDIAFSYRYYPSQFRSPYGYNFGESSNLSNEEGFYTALKYKGFKNISTSFYADIYRSFYTTYTLPLTLKGIELFNETVIKADKNNLFTFRLKYEDKSDNYRDEIIKDEYIYQKERYSARFEMKHKLNKDVYLRFRMETVAAHLQENRIETGYAGFSEISWQIFRSLKWGARLSYFSTDSYNSAIWQFEYAMPGLLSTTALYGEGIRAYGYIKYTILDKTDIWLRYSYLSKDHTESLGSSWNEIEGSNDSRIYLQIDAAF